MAIILQKNIFKYILKRKVLHFDDSLKFVPKGLIHYEPALVQEIF